MKRIPLLAAVSLLCSSLFAATPAQARPTPEDVFDHISMVQVPPPAPPPAAGRGLEGGSYAPATAAAVAPYTNARCGNQNGYLLITLDDWAYGNPARITWIGSVLQKLGVRAAFFLINQYVRQYPSLLATLHSQGHWTGNHTYSHVTLTGKSDATVKYQIVNGVKSNRLRPPGGAYNSHIQALAAGLGDKICIWTIDTRDWEKIGGRYPSATTVRARVRAASKTAKANGVILCHMFSNCPPALPGMISDLKAQGYKFCRNTGPVGTNFPFPLTC